MPNILVPVQTDRDTDWVANFLIKLHQRERIRVHLLSVQPPFTGHVRMFFAESEIHALRREDAQRQFALIRRALDAAGVPCNTHIVVGHLAEEITRLARALHSPQIVMGPPRGRCLSDLVLGSLTRQVEQLMRVSGNACEVL